MADRTKFFEYVREHLFGGHMSEGQMDGIAATLNEWDQRKLTDLRWLAYILATQKWETAHTMEPVRETLAKTDADARRRLGDAWYAVPDPVTGQSYYGRGDVQLTHKRNYATMTKLLGERFGVDLVKDPDKALVPTIATAIMFEGMTKGESQVGDFTGLSLEDFFNDSQVDWIGARRIINGTDRAADIADIALGFYAALTDSGPEIVTRLLRYGATGSDVIALQEVLTRENFYKGQIDGDFGPMTREAVINFQHARNLEDDGIVGELTRAALYA